MRDRAAYMRAYRAKDRSTPSPSVEGPNLSQDLEACREEVARLKRELARRPSVEQYPGPVAPERNPYREFRPVPKPGSKR